MLARSRIAETPTHLRHRASARVACLIATGGALLILRRSARRTWLGSWGEDGFMDG